MRDFYTVYKFCNGSFISPYKIRTSALIVLNIQHSRNSQLVPMAMAIALWSLYFRLYALHCCDAPHEIWVSISAIIIIVWANLKFYVEAQNKI